MGDTGAAKRPYLLVCAHTQESDKKKACRCGQAIFCISVYAYLRSWSGLAAERTALRATFAAGASDSLSAAGTVTTPV